MCNPDFPSNVSASFSVQEGRVKPKLVTSSEVAESPVLIVGAGIGGIAAGIALSNIGLKSTILDQRSSDKLFSGAGINLQAKAINALNDLGISTKSLIERGKVIKTQSYYLPDGRLVCNIDKKEEDGKPAQIAIHRGDLVQLLLDIANSRGIELLTNHRVVEVVQKSCPKEPVMVKSQLTTSTEHAIFYGPMVIGADGIHSRIRNQNITGNQNIDPLHYHGVTHYRGVVENFPCFLDGSTMLVVGGLRVKVIVYPISDSSNKNLQTINWVVAIKEENVNDSEVTPHHEHILRLLDSEEFCLDFLNLDSLIRETKSINAWPMIDLDPLQKWVDRRIGLLGDAAHAMLPVGSGGAMAALFDAVALREAFLKSGNVTVANVLRLYQLSRYDDASLQQQKCRQQPAENIVEEVLAIVPKTSDVPPKYRKRMRDTMKALHSPVKACEATGSHELKKRVIIVGAGASGLASCKEFAEKGFHPMVFESGSTFGGVFRDAYPNLELTSSSVFTAFSDYPPKEEVPTMWSASEYLSYLHNYAVDNDIFKYIRFNSNVSGVKRLRIETSDMNDGDGNDDDVLWAITVYDASANESYTVRGGKLVLSVGSNAKPNIPTFCGQDSFSGTIIHTSMIDTFEKFRGKRVLCLGMGESGSDVPYWIAKEPGTTVTMAVRGLGWCVPRRRPLNTGSPTDLNTNRLLWGLPRAFGRVLSYILARLDSRMDSDPVIRRMGLLNLKHSVGVYNTYGTKSINFLNAVEHLKAKYVPATIESMGPGNRVHFADGSEGEYDIVLLNTGYTKSSFEGFCFPISMGKEHDKALFNVLSEASYVRNLFKKVVHPAMKNLYFIGFARPGFGSIPAIAETQARWAASLASGRCMPLPSENEMVAEIASDKFREETQFGGAAARVTTLVDYLPYVNDIASLLGASPPYLRLLFSDPILFVKIMSGPATVAQLRLKGSDAKYDVARSTIQRYPPIPMRRLTFISAGLYLVSLLVLALSITLPISFQARKNLQPVGFPPLRNRLLQVARYICFWLHTFALAYSYFNMTNIPEIAIGIVVVIFSLEVKGIWQQKKREELLGEVLTSSADVKRLDTGKQPPNSSHMIRSSDQKSKSNKPLKVQSRVHSSFSTFAAVAFAMILASGKLFAYGFQVQNSHTRRELISNKQEQPIDSSSLTVTVAGGGLLDHFTKVNELDALERIALTSAGDLQTIFSAYHQQPVSVCIDHFALIDDCDGDNPAQLATFERKVSMSVSNHTLCKAASKIKVFCPKILKMLQETEVGLGQLLRKLALRPDFTLHDAGRNLDGGMWRFYRLDCSGISCDILEDFSADAWDNSPSCNDKVGTAPVFAVGPQPSRQGASLCTHKLSQ